MLHDLDQSKTDLSEFHRKQAGTIRITTVQHTAHGAAGAIVLIERLQIGRRERDLGLVKGRGQPSIFSMG
ncbi:hypothetical protein [Rhizobium sp. Root1204]|uniref:hypothetical protein n=1 Tax=Rhizobium sp. Root1204 TaxID=1736428 RepID=UPI000712A909|nr:hypothetical protein [Rhizobium sp. Root1204]KQV41277.1 hypothetical protein ASC96_18435 [Rhizobium sp. Root1204]